MTYLERLVDSDDPASATAEPKNIVKDIPLQLQDPKILE